MYKINEYIIVSQLNAESLTKVVNEKIKDGWQPLGGIAIQMVGDEKVTFTQAMVKYKPMI